MNPTQRFTIPAATPGGAVPSEVRIEGIGVVRRDFLVELIAQAASNPQAMSRLTGSSDGPAAPFQFGSFDLFRAELARAIEHRRGVDGYSPKTLSSMRTAVNSFSAFLSAVRATETFVRGDFRQQRQLVSDWTAAVRARVGSHDTVNAYWRSLKSAFSTVAELNGSFNPFTGLRPPRPGQRRIRAITPDSLYVAYDFLRNRQAGTELERLRDLAVFALAAMAGLRHGEILRLKVSQIDLETGRIHVSKGKGRYGGKDRIAQLISDAIPIVQAYAAVRQEAQRTHSEFITSVSRDRPMSEKSVLGIFQRIEAATKIHVRPHMCRHTYNVLLEKAGVRDAVRMNLLGHTRLQALQYYTHAFDGEAEEAGRSIQLGLDTESLLRRPGVGRAAGSGPSVSVAASVRRRQLAPPIRGRVAEDELPAREEEQAGRHQHGGQPESLDGQADRLHVTPPPPGEPRGARRASGPSGSRPPGGAPPAP